MGDYVRKIRDFERQRNALSDAIRQTVERRRESPAKYQEWKNAAAAFATHHSPLDPLFAQCFYASAQPVTPDLRAFMFDYIAVDPQFFRSGYILERILRRIKKLALSRSEKRAVQKLLVTRVKERGLRNFRDICRLVPVIEDGSLRTEIENLACSDHDGIRHRARFALSYFGTGGR